MDGGGVVQTAGRIGPNAILQLVSVLDRSEGRAMRDRVMTAAGVGVPPPDSGMIPQEQAAAAHLALRLVLPDRADAVLREAGLATADYILANRIPAPARAVIRAMPSALGARLLAGAIARHAWTFAGSGAFSIAGWHPLTLDLMGNPLADPGGGGCLWHVAVFERLFAQLVWPDVHVHEVSCAARGGPVCRFELRPHLPRH
jgi:divinyl protochlorophyllide a 8-vinyl-reductase